MYHTLEDYQSAKSQAQRRFNEAYAQRSAYCRQENEYRAAEKAHRNNLNVCRFKKLNFEERVYNIEQAIRKIEEMDGSISQATNWGKKTDAAYSKCIRCSDYAGVSFNDTFHVKSVSEDKDLQTAIQKLKAEKQRLLQALADLKREIAQNEAQVEALQQRIRSCAASAAVCSAKMAAMSFTVNVCTREINRMSV